MSEVKDPAIKLFGRTISLPHINDSSSASAPKPTPSSSSSPREVTSATQQHEPEESSRKELTSSQDDDASHQIREDVKSPTTSSSILENPKTRSGETDTSTIPKSLTNGEESETSDSEEKAPKKPDKILPCPRCNSMDTKFCYYNNYNVNQPRHFCKNCQRYWTAGGTMRNVPVGAGRRKNKSSSATASYYQHIMLPNGLNNAVLGNGGAVLTFGPDSPLTDTMASRLNIAERAKSCVPNGFHATEPNSFVSYRKEDDGTSGVSVGTTSSSSHSGSQSHESVDKRVEGFTPQLPYFPSAPWSYPMPPPTYPLSFYPTQAYWGCMPMPPSWNNNSVSAPTLGKHSRDENIIAPSNPQREMHDVEHNSSEHSVFIPKALRIEDHSEAAKSSMWSKLGIKNDKSSSGGLFNVFPSKGNHIAEEASPVLQVNPAALSRSLAFHEQT